MKEWPNKAPAPNRRPRVDMRQLILILSQAALVGCKSTPRSNQRDHALEIKLEGTWLTVPSENQAFSSKATYRSDGTGIERVWSSGQPESQAVRVETSCAITNGILTIVSISSSDPQKIPSGIELKDRIISVSETELIFEPIEGYGGSAPKRVIKKRIKDGF
jgi:hypothetical protein